MYIKSITINGFKSFAEKTSLDFAGPAKGRQSITAIVGPNGSGKSNVSDAIRWVLGEQSMKQLRGKKSQDIIFSGSASKGKMGSASVTFTLDNKDKRIPLDYDDVSITRKIYQSGESEYLVNGSTVRLLDLQILLAKGQFGQGAYSIIGQGMIDRLVLQTSAERKKFFDEAVGIKEFQIKRHQAVLKLSRTEAHLEQAELLLGEISPRLKTLSRQVKKLEQRKVLEVELLESQEKYYSTLYHYNNDKIETLKKELEEIKQEEKTQQESLEAMQVELATLAKDSSRERFYDLQQEYQKAMKGKSALEKEKAFILNKLQTEYSQAGQQNVAWMKNKLDEITVSLKEVKKERKELQSKLQELKKTQREEEGRLGDLLIEKTQLQNRLARLETDILNASYQQSINQFTGLRAVEAIRDKKKVFGEVFGTVSELAAVDEKFRVALDVAAGGQLSSLVVEDEKVAESCIHYLRKNQLGIATFLPLTKIRGRRIPEDLFVYLDWNGVYGFATDLLEYDEKFDEIFSFILGNTLVVENIALAREIGVGRVRMVTLSGDILERSGAMKGGFRKKRKTDLSFGQKHSESSANADRLQEEREELRAEYEKLEETIDTLRSSVNKNETEIQVLSGKFEILENQEQNMSSEHKTLEQELALSDMSEEDFGNAMVGLARQKVFIEAEIEKADEELEELQTQIDAFNKEEEKKKERVFELQETMQSSQMAVNALVEKKNIKQVELARYETKLEDLDEECYREIHDSLENLAKKGIPALDIALLDSLQANIQKVQYKLHLIGGIDEEVLEEYEEVKARHDELFTQLDDLKKAISDLNTLIEELDTLMKKRRKTAFKDIRKEFQRYFSLLFEGGKADLVEIFGDEDVEGELEELFDEDIETKPKKKAKKVLTGIDISACPPGKKIKNIQALSGGERTMTAIALVCAILHTNPPPFVLLDEVEAALDEANTLRFTKILQELSESSQFILITHNRATMHAADALYGVTMGNDGVSRLLSVDMKK